MQGPPGDYATARKSFSCVIQEDSSLNEALTRDRKSRVFTKEFFDLIDGSGLDDGSGLLDSESRRDSYAGYFASQGVGSKINSNFLTSGGDLYRFDSKALPSRRGGRKNGAAAQEQQHLQMSADLFDIFSPLQKERQLVKPDLADAFKDQSGFTALVEDEIPGLIARDEKQLAEAYPNIFSCSTVRIFSHAPPPGGGGSSSSAAGEPFSASSSSGTFIVNAISSERKHLRVGLILNGGPAPGGHNVIAGVYDYIKSISPSESQLLGFMGGIDGFLAKKFVLVDDDKMRRFRNSGGFDMLWSGRGKITKANKPDALRVADELSLDGLIIVGGDGSNSNAAILAEYLAECKSKCCIIGVPKTIDGDLKSAAIECSFGFDTAAKTYSELIGNLCVDASSGQGVWHFVRVMGRSASHLVLECAMQTRPNLAFIGEEIKANETSLAEIVKTIVDLIIERRKMGRNYGVVIVPEGLISFIPEMERLLEDILKVCNGGAFDREKLQEANRKVWDFLPAQIRDQFLEDREASGYVQVAKIATERLLMSLVEQELARHPDGKVEEFSRMPHYFG